MSNPLERYQQLALGEALSRIHLYKLACKELCFILRSAYGKLPKNVQSVVFQDTLAAFRLLPQISMLGFTGHVYQRNELQLAKSENLRTQTAASAANLLLRSAEVSLQKQKKSLAITEFKQAKVAHKRLCKARQEEKDSAHLPQDVLVQIFGFLDVKSLASVGLVCWSWNLAASDNRLWHLQYNVFFGESDICLKRLHRRNPIEDKNCKLPQKDLVRSNEVDWKEAFRRSAVGNSSKRLSCDRGHCEHCNTIVWLNETKHSKSHCGSKHENHLIKPISVHQVVEYLLDGSVSTTSSSDSDSDSDDGLVSKLWAYPKNINRQTHKPFVM